MLHLSNQPKSVEARSSADVGGRLEAGADCRSFGLAEKLATIVVRQVKTPGASRFAVGHARNGRRDRNRDAASTALSPALHCTSFRGAVF